MLERTHSGYRPTEIGLIVALVFICAGAACGASPPAVGDKAPDFELQGSDGATHRLSDYRGQFVVLAWFPKAFTGG